MRRLLPIRSPCAMLLACLLHGGGAVADSRHPVPDANAQRDAAKLVAEVYKSDLAAAKSAESKPALARKLIKAASETTGEVAGRHAMLSLARSLAADGGDAVLALDVVEQLAAAFQVDALPLAIESGRVAIRVANPAASKAVAPRFLALCRTAVGEDRYDLATQCADLLITAARRSGDGPAVADATLVSRDVAAIQQAHRDLATAKAFFDRNPKDPDMSLAVGRFLALMKGDWAGGLPLLGRSSDPMFVALVAREQSGPATAEQRLGVADGWWDVSDKQTGLMQRRARVHAAQWYTDAIPGLQGLARAKAETRVKETASAGGLAAAGPGPTTRPSSNAVELVKLIDLARDVTKLPEQWSKSDAGIIADGTKGWTGLRLPNTPKGDYDMTVRFTRLEGNGWIEVYAKHSNRLVGFLALYEGKLLASATSDGQRVQLTRTGSDFKPVAAGAQNTMVMQVRKDRISISVNGTPVIEHHHDLTKMKPQSADNLMLAVHHAKVRYESVELVEVGAAPVPK